MSQDLPSGGHSSLPLSREERRAAAIAAGREKRAKNRASLLRRERESDEPSSPLLAAVKTSLGAVFFIPLFAFIGMAVLNVDQRFGTLAAWIAGIAALGLAAFIAYYSPELLRAFMRQFRGGAFSKRKLETPWATLMILVLLPVILLIAVLFGDRTLR